MQRRGPARKKRQLGFVTAAGEEEEADKAGRRRRHGRRRAAPAVSPGAVAPVAAASGEIETERKRRDAFFLGSGR